MLVVGAAVAAVFGILLGAPTLRLRGDYLAIVTLGFGEIVPIVFLNARRRSPTAPTASAASVRPEPRRCSVEFTPAEPVAVLHH